MWSPTSWRRTYTAPRNTWDGAVGPGTRDRRRGYGDSASKVCSACAARPVAAHPAFDIGNPNKIRSVYSAFVHTNLRNFHARDGSGYNLIGDVVIELNGLNPQMAAALAKPLTRWRRFAGEQSRMMTATLERVAACEELSADVFEVVEKGLSG